MDTSVERPQESDLVRTPEYWAKLEQQVRNDVTQRNAEFQRALGLSSEREFLKLIVTTGAGKFPSVRITSRENIEVYFPVEYFEYMDNASKWMNMDVPYRGALTLANTFPRQDLSLHFNSVWSRWILLHEVGHVICGHLGRAGAHHPFVEFPVVDRKGGAADGLPLPLRRAMEVDADIWAARAMFWTYGTMTLKGYWDDLYHFEDSVDYAMQDLALILWPLFLELDHASPDTPTTHPTTFERLVLMRLFGFNSYLKRVGEAGKRHLGFFEAGSKKAMELTAHFEGTLIHKKPPSSMDVVAYWRELTAVGMAIRRRHPIEDDWLLRVPPSELAAT